MLPKLRTRADSVQVPSVGVSWTRSMANSGSPLAGEPVGDETVEFDAIGRLQAHRSQQIVQRRILFFADKFAKKSLHPDARTRVTQTLVQHP